MGRDKLVSCSTLLLAIHLLVCSVTAQSCDFYAAEIHPQSNQQIAGGLEVLDIAELSFDLVIHGNWMCIGVFCNILHLGTFQFPRLPLISFVNDSVNPDHWLHIRYSLTGNENAGYDVFNATKKDIVLDGESHTWYFKWTKTERIFMVDDTPWFTSTGTYDSSSYFGSSYKLFVTDPEHFPARIFNGTITNLCYSSYTPEPTQTPTDHPSNHPTIGPSTDPTNIPTTLPSIAPSNVPSTAPSSAPSDTPTLTPSIAPSFPPTRAPSNTPTSPPSVAPSNAPTTCYEGNTFTNDGYEESVADKVLNLGFAYKVHDVNKILVANEAMQYLDEVLSLKQEIHCSASASCLGANIIFTNSTLCNLICNDMISCHDAIIDVHDCDKTEIICNGSKACESMIVTVSSGANSDSNLLIWCGIASSCNDMIIDVVGDIHSNIHCIGLHSCDGIEVNIGAAKYAQNILNMHSFSHDVTFNNGFGYEEQDASAQYISCNEATQFVEYNVSNTDQDALIALVESEYMSNIFACDGVTVQCFTKNDSNVTSQCEMKYAVDISGFNIPETDPLASCYWVPVSDIIVLSCDGDCVSSPTQGPTPAPTSNPTFPTSIPTYDPTSQPTIQPTMNPTIQPTLYPSDHPTSAPSFSPSQVPSANPTAAPSSIPSMAPTQSPTLNPSRSPTAPPTLAPSFSPSLAPSLSPTLNPSLSPTLFPSNSPSLAPSFAPSSAPTLNPSLAPSFSPTINPSLAPSLAPSNTPTSPPSSAPTRLPTADADTIYDTKIEIEYSVHNLTEQNKYFIVNSTDKVVADIEQIIESKYFDIKNALYYDDFWVNVYQINGVNMQDRRRLVNNDDATNALTIYDLDILKPVGVYRQYGCNYGKIMYEAC
eukprot:337236_1